MICSAPRYRRGPHLPRGGGRWIVASDVVRQLVAGKGFSFAERGEVMLKGIDDPVRLFEVHGGNSWERSVPLAAMAGGDGQLFARGTRVRSTLTPSSL